MWKASATSRNAATVKLPEFELGFTREVAAETVLGVIREEVIFEKVRDV